MENQKTEHTPASLYKLMDQLYDGIEGQKWMSIEQRDTMLNSLAVFIAQYEAIARWCVGDFRVEGK